MYRHARNLEFEQAALLRDQLDQLRQFELDLAAATSYDVVPPPKPVAKTG
jgi:excinuclease UvrABC nuclease subunit